MAEFDMSDNVLSVTAVEAVITFCEICNIVTSSMIVMSYFYKIEKVILCNFLQLRPF